MDTSLLGYLTSTKYAKHYTVKTLYKERVRDNHFYSTWIKSYALITKTILLLIMNAGMV